MKKILILIFIGASFGTDAQLFSFDPGVHHIAVLPYEQLSIIETKIYNLTADDMIMDWGMVENTCPQTDWYWELCDWGHCFSYIPNSGEMLSVPSGSFGFISLYVNPYLIDGWGMVHFWVYPDNQIELGADVYFDFATPGVSVNETTNEFLKPYPNPANQFIRLFANGNVQIVNMHGKCVANIQASGLTTIDISQFETGMYFIQTENGIAQKLIVE